MVNEIGNNYNQNFPTYLDNAGAAGAANGTQKLQDNLDLNLLQKIKSGDKSNNISEPDQPPANVNMQSLQNWIVATPSPGCALAAIMVKEAAQQNEQNQQGIMQQTEAVQKNIMEQADNIHSAAVKQLVGTLVGVAANSICATISSFQTLKVDANVSQNAFQQAMVKPNAVAQGGRLADQTFNALGNYLSARDQADNKRLDAAIEGHRSIQESLRNSQQMQRDLMSKSLDFINSMQANTNQTRAKILV
ncbi:MAG: hypothetical protein IJU79_01580 [Desulfovibrionaceae bacterium]|nr:hypothetical protein [Desulfovibrionaceae bacterium]